MDLAMVGLGRMGGSMAQRLLAGGHRVVACDPSPQALAALVQHGAVASASLADLVAKLSSPRVVWLMLPAGDATENTINELSGLLSSGDIIIDGGNSNYKDSMRRAAVLWEKGIRFLDIGTSGGIWGLKEGYCLMVGGSAEAYQHIEPLLRTLAPSPTQGYGRVGKSGAGHFVKMVHNGIEYGLMQSYAEGFELLQAKEEFDLDLAQLAGLWRHGSVIRSWLLDLLESALKEDPDLATIQAYVEDSGEGRWTVQEAVDLGIPLPVITQALQARFRSRQQQPFAAKILAALRRQFGGHGVRKAE